ncbi:MAG: hypothetical protein EPN82_11885 [Bacteroidetes bacterium]|nr:MAG: hypothetical protein EPN82_11885 [Bacteroidota bacterium]
MNLNKDFREFAELLNFHKVEYLVVGGYALAFHGSPRYTGDIDFWINPTIDNSKKMIKVLNDFGFSSLQLTEKDFQEKDKVFQFGFPPYRIDVLTSVTGLEFDECYSKRNEISDDDVKISFIDIESFKINKKAMGRTKDLADLESLT